MILWFFVALIPIAIVGIIHGVEFAKEEERNETIRKLAEQRYSAQEIREIMKLRHGDESRRRASKYDVERARIQADLVRQLVSRGMSGTEIAEILRSVDLNSDKVEKQVKTIKSKRQEDPLLQDHPQTGGAALFSSGNP